MLYAPSMQKIILTMLLAVPLLPLLSHSFTSFHVVSVPQGSYVAQEVSVNDGLIVIYWSTQPITFLVMTPQQYSNFVYSYSGSAVYSAVAQYFDQEINLPPGIYYVVFYNNVSGGSATVGFYTISRPAPTGIADYGVEYSGGTLTPYTLTFNEIVGQVSFQGQPSGYVVGSGGNSFSVQLNAVIYVSTSSGPQELWAQDVAVISGGTMFFGDNLWNFTAPNAPLSGVTGSGKIYNGQYYAYATPLMPFQQSFKFVMAVKQSSSNSILVSFGYSLPGENTVWFDNATVTFSSQVNGAYFEVNGNAQTGSNNAYDAELVMGGPSNGTNYNFTSLDVALNMYYVSGESAVYPLTTYMFGIDTAEGACDVYTGQNGIATVGYDYYPYVSTQGQAIQPLIITGLSYSKEVDSAKPVLYFNLSVSGGQQPYYVYLTVSGPNYQKTFTLSYWGYENSVNLGSIAPGTYKANLTVADSLGQKVYTTFTFVVVPPPRVEVLSNSSTVVTGSAVEFVSNVTGGVAPYSYSWYVNGSFAGSSQVLTYRFTSPGVYNVSVVITDSYGVKAGNWTLVTVYPPLAVEVMNNYTTVDVNVTDVFVVKIISGEPPFSFRWLVNGTTVGASNVLDYAFRSPGTYNVTVVVTSKSGITSKTVLVKVNPKLEVNVMLPKGVEQGVPTVIYVNVSGGTPPYTVSVGNYSETVKEAEILSFTLVYNSSGSEKAIVRVSDSGGSEFFRAFTLTVVPHVTAEIELPYPTLDEEAKVSITANVSGGFPPYEYEWFVNGQPASNSSTLTVEASQLGNISIALLVRDSLNATYYTYRIIEVVEPPRFVEIHVANVSEVGLSPEVNYTITGGTPPYRVLLLLNGTQAKAFHSPGVYRVSVVVFDAYNETATFVSYVKVYPRIYVSLVMPSLADEDVLLKPNITIIGGVPPYHEVVEVNGTPAGQVLDFTSPGVYNVTVSVTDSLGVRYTATYLVRVVPKPQVFVIPTTSSTYFVNNASVALSVEVTGGVSPKVVVFLNGVRVAVLAPNSTFQTSLSPGLNNVTVIAVDSFNQTSYYTLLVETTYNYLDVGVTVGVPVLAVVLVVLVKLVRK